MRKTNEMLFSSDIRNLMLQIYMNDMISLGDVDAILDCDGFELSGIDIKKTSVSPHIARIAKRYSYVAKWRSRFLNTTNRLLQETLSLRHRRSI